jgi:hypothetical protein
MRKALVVEVICLAGFVAFAAENLHPLNVKTGLWQISETVTWSGLPPEYLC